MVHYTTKDKNQSGFTLLETIIALFIFSIAFTGLLSVSTHSVKSLRASSHRITAQLLAQEGIELVENKKMSNFLTYGHQDPTLWLDGLVPECTSGCYAEAVTSQTSGTTFTSCQNGVCPPIKRFSNGLYGYGSGGDTTPFERRIFVEMFDNDHYLVTSFVQWREGDVIKSIDIKREMSNWFQPPKQ